MELSSRLSPTFYKVKKIKVDLRDVDFTYKSQAINRSTDTHAAGAELNEKQV